MDHDTRQPRASSPGHQPGNLGQVVASRLLGCRRLVLAMASRFANRRFVFAFAATSVLCAKAVHIYTHMSALSEVHLLRWGYSFFAQDMALLIIVRLLLDGWLFSSATANLLRLFALALAALFITYVAALGVITVAFFAVAGSEIHWRNIAFASDASSRALLLSAFVSFALVLCALLAVAWALQDALFIVVGFAADIVMWPLKCQARCGHIRLRLPPPYAKYSEIPQQDIESGTKNAHIREQQGLVGALVDLKTRPWAWIFRQLTCVLVGVALLAQIVLLIIRPHEGSLTFMSWTPALLPFVDFKNSSPNLDRLVPVYGSGINRTWDSRTALDDPISLSWLPQDSIPMGFDDWYGNKTHYQAAADPLKISNLDDELLPLLRKELGDVPIRHVMVIVLESTRKDLFPIKKDGLIWKRLANSFDDKTMPEEAQKRLATLTSTANFLTSDYEDGFEHAVRKGRGGVNFNNAYTTSTYTLKSLVGTLCGITPLIADFNLEYSHHIYQPCLPQIFNALNTLDHDDSDNFTSYEWRSSFLQSVTLDFDHFDPLMLALGFPADALIARDYLKSESAKFGRVDLPDINYFGMPEICLEDYIRDAFASAKKNNERVFMTHVTSTSHHPFAMPTNETYVPLSNGLDDLSHFVNSIGYDDRWLGRILEILDQQGAADETLVVLVGDHGFSIPENDILSSYYNPNVGSNHVPLVLSHPKLPAIDVDDAVSSLQILPTVLDLLLETGSLSKSASQAARDLVHNYEGQSLVRSLRKQATVTEATNQTGQLVTDWQYTVINPGRAMVGVRDSLHEHWRLVVPVVDNVEWHFTDLSSDPIEAHPVVGFEFLAFLASVEQKHGIDAARWVEEAAFAARWWVEENSKRWRYGPYAS
ncbi:hypothetical protein TOPH_07091 [Tolypocladium ophioglossoides CBS 100239]|uniref:Sulfatase N-terminal domain-containing protein n=1 Tax=Tolypocladium ophioglossoides (strain CBS 100239) TaxID=1163406 RepID=A0A0L0N2N3_TOLOC|nr:hypothetical protein TOPH_07091 [Tolypocladium ophioglossoides CBS 100239]